MSSHRESQSTTFVRLAKVLLGLATLFSFLATYHWYEDINTPPSNSPYRALDSLLPLFELTVAAFFGLIGGALMWWEHRAGKSRRGLHEHDE